ncbi:MAG: CBS domain-containing protein [Saprospiraceae bacterium]|nr:CBS domain-containing protein [Saprospiraceae bacterium]
MIAENLLSSIILPLRTSDTGEEAIGLMSDFHIRHLPIVNDRQLLGLLSEDDVLNNDAEEAVGSYALSLPSVYVKHSDHIFEVMRLLAEHNLSIVPVVDDQHNYLGLITMEDLLRYFASTVSFIEPGCIIVLEIAKRDYSLAEIARIVESENAAIISAFITTNAHSERLEVTLKINRLNVHGIIATFERFKYVVKASFYEAEYFDSLRERYDALMSYLNV